MIVYANTTLKIFLNTLVMKIDSLESLLIYRETAMCSIKIGIDRNSTLLLSLEVIWLHLHKGFQDELDLVISMQIIFQMYF
jgi:hypothetical protein